MLIPPCTLAFLDILSGPELIVVLAVVLIFFGGEKMPEFARGLGKVIREFRKAAGDVEREFKRVIEEVEHPVKDVLNPVLTAPPEHPPAPYTPPVYHPDDTALELPPADAHAAPPASEPPSPNRIRSEPPAMPEI